MMLAARVMLTELTAREHARLTFLLSIFFLLLRKSLSKGHLVLCRHLGMGSSESVTDQASTLTAMDNLGALQEEQTER